MLPAARVAFLLLLLLSCTWASDDAGPAVAEHLRYFSFYSHGDRPEVLSAQRGIVNVRLGHDAHYDLVRSWWTWTAGGGLVTNFTDVLAGHRQFGMSSFLDVEQLVWNRSSYPTRPAFPTTRRWSEPS